MDRFLIRLNALNLMDRFLCALIVVVEQYDVVGSHWDAAVGIVG